MKNSITLENENGCVMDSDAGSLGDSPTEVLSDSWIPKEYTGASFTGSGFSECSGKITFIPVQVATTKSISIDAMGYYVGTFSGSIGGFGQTDHTVNLDSLCGEGQHVFLKSVEVQCSTDDLGNGVHACLIAPTSGMPKSSELKFRSINTDASTATQTRTFKVFIKVTAEISNTDFGLGKLFPDK